MITFSNNFSSFVAIDTNKILTEWTQTGLVGIYILKLALTLSLS